MEQKKRVNNDKRIGTGRKTHLQSSGSFYITENKSDSYTTIIQVLKSDLIQIQEMINENTSDIKMYKLLSKFPGLTKKLSDIEESRTINNVIEKISEDSKNLNKIYKLYNCKDNELISKLYLELSYNELLLKKIYDYFILMKLKLYKDDTYQETLSKIISIQTFMEMAKKLSPNTGNMNQTIMQLSIDKENLTKQINELTEKNTKLSNERSNNSSTVSSSSKNDNEKKYKEKFLELTKEIEKLKNEIDILKNKKEENINENIKENNNQNKNNVEIQFKNSAEFKKILQKFEKNIEKSRNNFSELVNGEIKELKIKISELETNLELIKEEKDNLQKNIDRIRGEKKDPDSYEEVLKYQNESMKKGFIKKIDDLNEKLVDLKQEYQKKIYQTEEELKEAQYLKELFLNQVVSLQKKLEVK